MSCNYLEKIKSAIGFSQELGLKNLVLTPIEDQYTNKEELENLLKIVNGHLFDFIEQRFAVYPYWGDMCLDLNAHAFMYLHALGYNVDMVFGNVNVNNSPEDEFNVTKESLKDEYINRITQGNQDLHAWVNVGGEIILDFALMPRLIKNYDYPREFGDVICFTTDILEKNYKLIYKPILVGSDFFATTNSYNPLKESLKLKAILKSQFR
ncbi:hypothetical protein [Acinetobacter beijerinckii]|uniref:Uncharacterized protein n=1 Tax=Acinetobacter beijerinckii CIP 110307 TaxID=1217648 RepID=N9FI35_9GAMM|nr:hypothetical protein [Acinetobacter beijerinckii]ENW06970.1 hypothetical protein F933_01430 [Acinetobacter beijerinckii CIP 110307]